MIMASVALAAIKIGGVLLDLSPVQTILIASIVTVIYSSLGGLTGIIWTDFFQFIIENLLIEGQIEQWVIIIDLGNASIFSLGKSMLDIIVHLSAIFKVRAVHNYLINCPSSIKILWKALKSALNEDQIRKISMSEKKKLKPDTFRKINPSQVEEKYGGTYKNIETYWYNYFNIGHPI